MSRVGRVIDEGVNTGQTKDSPHDLGRHAHHRTHNVLAQNRQAQLLRHTSTGEQYRRRAVRHLTGVTGVSAPVFAECWFELGERFLGDPIPNSIVGVDNDFLFVFRLGIGPLDLDISIIVITARPVMVNDY